ncbi:DUF58 domain-containing protein [Halomontanus rarus]|uniref:DUF58 domain-containing protein n=1 Tax=Halomontanus rarus TaxID=3034020 RepID=UPI0023E7DA1C|nr:DUF58 domain-containing protein [Halovivax sp. TS33]
MSASSSYDALVRKAAFALGLIAVVLGAVTLIVVTPLVHVLPSSFALVAAGGGLAFLLGLWMLRTRLRSDVSNSRAPDVERTLSTPPPGNDIDEALFRVTEFRQGTVEYRDRIQQRLASAAVDVIRQRDDCSRGEAVRQLEDGTWTDNPYAKSFFADGSPPKRSLSERLRDRLADETDSSYERWVRITLDEIVSLAEVDVGSDSPAGEVDDEDEDEDSGFLSAVLNGSVVPASTSYRTVPDREQNDRQNENVVYHALVNTGHWTGISAFALVALGWGVVTFDPAVMFLSVTAIGFVTYARLMTEPGLSDLEVERTVSTPTPQPGDPVDVTVTVRNTGDSFLPDLRLIDRVPGSMEVVSGSPRLATGLSGGSTASFSYTVVAERGVHEWPLTVLGRDISGSIEREATIEVDGTLDCAPSLKTWSDAPVRSKTSLYSGQVDTDMGGGGLEFFAIREYREGDPMKRIDWSRRARTGEFATIEFRQERSAQVVLLFDARESAYVSPGPNERHAVDHAVDAGMGMFASLFDRNDLVGVAAFDTVPCWLAPGAGDGHAERARRLFAEHPAIASTPPSLLELENKYVDPMTHVRRQLSPEAQIMLFSPLCDDYPAEVARRLDSIGHLVTIVSPDPTADRTIGQRLASIERAMRVRNLREHGIRVIDWEYDEPLGLEIERAKQRWAV